MGTVVPISDLIHDGLECENLRKALSTSYIPLHEFGIEFQYVADDIDQTHYNLARWYKHNDTQNIGSLPEPFFTDFISMCTARAHGIDLDNELDKLAL